MTAYLARRVLAVIPVMIVVVTVVFLLIHLIPGDPVAVILGPEAILSALRARGRELPALSSARWFATDSHELQSAHGWRQPSVSGAMERRPRGERNSAGGLFR